MSSFEGKVIWITGASSGIGEALAYEWSKLGAHVILSARRKSELGTGESSMYQQRPVYRSAA